jgi:flavin-dependent dehydrogenase
MFDVVVIGGGPAGATTATFLSKMGHKVLVLEKDKFPRDHVGESLLPFCYSLFKELDMLDQMKANFVRKPGVRFYDSDGRQETTWCFNRVIPDESYLSFQVVRSEFDSLQLENSRRHGATVMEETRVESVDLDSPDGSIVVRAIGRDQEIRTFQARFLVDCSGRNTFLANRFGIKKKFEELDRTAFWTHWKGAPLKGGLEEGLSLIVYLGGEKKGWMWIFPLEPDRLTVGVVLNNSYIRAEKSKFQDQGIKDWQMALYEQELGYSSYAKDLLSNAQIVQPLVVEGDYSYYTEKKYGPNYAMVGDAATFIDPIFSSGIFIAMKGSQLVSESIHKLLSGEEDWETSLSKAYAKIDGAYRMVSKLIHFFYSVNTINFAQMGAASELIHQQHEKAMAVGHFLLAGDFFDRYEEYGKVIDILRRPRIFEAWNGDLMLKRRNIQDSTCNSSLDNAFHQLLRKDSKKFESV